MALYADVVHSEFWQQATPLGFEPMRAGRLLNYKSDSLALCVVASKQFDANLNIIKVLNKFFVHVHSSVVRYAVSMQICLQGARCYRNALKWQHERV